jgi:hypothetical protein
VTLRDARRLFATKPTARILALYVLVTAAVRVVVGGFTWVDAAIALGILALEPLTEWLIHVHLLHFRPRASGFDLRIAKKHRVHHADPRDLDILFIPMEVVAMAPLAAIGVPLLAQATLGHALTIGLTGFSMLLVYEWTHFLIHTPYQPRTKTYRRIWRAHRWHHFRNEHYWFGVTIHTADRLLGTYPDKDAVELSPTARSLHSDLG